MHLRFSICLNYYSRPQTAESTASASSSVGLKIPPAAFMESGRELRCTIRNFDASAKTKALGEAAAAGGAGEGEEVVGGIPSYVTFDENDFFVKLPTAESCGDPVKFNLSRESSAVASSSKRCLSFNEVDTNAIVQFSSTNEDTNDNNDEKEEEKNITPSTIEGAKIGDYEGTRVCLLLMVRLLHQKLTQMSKLRTLPFR